MEDKRVYTLRNGASLFDDLGEVLITCTGEKAAILKTDRNSAVFVGIGWYQGDYFLRGWVKKENIKKTETNQKVVK